MQLYRPFTLTVQYSPLKQVVWCLIRAPWTVWTDKRLCLIVLFHYPISFVAPVRTTHNVIVLISTRSLVASHHFQQTSTQLPSGLISQGHRGKNTFVGVWGL